MMADLQALFQTVDELSPDELKQLYLYITQTRVQFAAGPIEEPTESGAAFRPRMLGLFEAVGETWMSDDFDAELPDSFWLGEGQP